MGDRLETIISWCRNPYSNLQTFIKMHLTKKIFVPITVITLIAVFMSWKLIIPPLVPSRTNNAIMVSDIWGGKPSLIRCTNGSYMIAFWSYDGIYVTMSRNGSSWSAPNIAVSGFFEADYFSLIQCRDGSFMMAFTSNDDEEGSIYSTTSKDGYSWSVPIKFLTMPYQLNDISLIQCKNGSYMIAYVVDILWVEVRSSEDGLSWSPPVCVLISPGWVKGKSYPYEIFFGVSLIQNDDGSYMVATADLNTDVIVIYESQDGSTWRPYYVLPAEVSIDLSLIQTANGSYVIAFDSYKTRPTQIYLTKIREDVMPKQITEMSGDCYDPSLIQLTDGSYMVAFSSGRRIFLAQTGF